MVGYGDACTSDSQCPGHSYCHHITKNCQTSRGRQMVGYGDACTSDDQCPGHSYCHHITKNCQTSRGREVSREIAFGEVCEADFECPAFGYCGWTIPRTCRKEGGRYVDRLLSDGEN